jgi:hypothetical protein
VTPRYRDAMNRFSHLFRPAIALLCLASMSLSGICHAQGERTWPQVLRAQMARLNEVGYRLEHASPGLCEKTGAATGIAVDHIGAYAPGDRELVARSLSMTSLPQVAAVAPGSPAAVSGVEPGDDLIAIDGQDTAAFVNADWDKGLVADAIEDALWDALPGHSIHLRLERGSIPIEVSIRPERLCRTRFILKSNGGLEAHTDAINIAVGWKLMQFTQNDSELAIALGHELAHVVYGDLKASNLAERRMMESRADLMGAAIMRCAGYDIGGGVEFWKRYNAKNWLRWTGDPTHRNVPARIRAIQSVAARPAACPPDRATYAKPEG